MPDDPVEELRRLYDEWANGNLLALREVADPDIEWEWADEMASLFGGPRIYRGLDEIWAATKEWLTAWDHYWMTADEFIEAGDRVVVLMRLHARDHTPSSQQRAFGREPRIPVARTELSSTFGRIASSSSFASARELSCACRSR